MKCLYVLCGAMGVGKSATGRALRDLLPDCAFLDGDWCWDMHPFRVTEVTKRVVLDNICHALNNFLTCGAFENIVFCWVLHRREILGGILARLDTRGWEVRPVALTSTPEALTARHQRDVAAGKRDEGSLARPCLSAALWRTGRAVVGHLRLHSARGRRAHPRHAELKMHKEAPESIPQCSPGLCRFRDQPQRLQ